MLRGRLTIRCCVSPDALSRRCATAARARTLDTAEHVGDLGMQTASDSAISDYALREATAIVTKDEDFAQRKVLTDRGPAVIWIRLPNTRRRELLEWFEDVLPDILLALQRGETLVEVI
jgi:predicted nuclease of predicted toxin-antitoxin system